MTKASMLFTAMLGVGFLLGMQSARAHCDSLDGPVAKAVYKSLETGNVNTVLIYAPASADKEIRTAFEKSQRVRNLSPDARELADRAFIETVIRLHRAGEGAAYTGLKPAGIDYGPVVRAAEEAVGTGDPTKLKVALLQEIANALTQRLAHLRELQNVSLDPTTAIEVSQARERVSAELGFITFSENIRQAALGKGSEHHAD